METRIILLLNCTRRKSKNKWEIQGEERKKKRNIKLEANGMAKKGQNEWFNANIKCFDERN